MQVAFTERLIEANRLIYYRLKRGLDTRLCRAHDIGEGGDVSKGVDLFAEEIFIQELSSFGMIQSEEAGKVGSGDTIIWLDPIDGSDNFLSQIPYYGSSVALEIDGEVEVAGVVNFANGDIFIKDAQGLRCAKLDDLHFEAVQKNPYASVGIFERAYRSKIYAERLRRKEIKYRMLGAMALSLAYAHYVDFVIFEDRLRPYDVKAGMKMCENLYKYQYNDLTLICHDAAKFEYYKTILLED